MYIISATANGSGGYPPLQEWHSQTCPTGYYFYPNEYFGVFYPQGKRVAGFVKYEADEELRLLLPSLGTMRLMTLTLQRFLTLFLPLVRTRLLK